jgi:hypothetical protein
MILGSSDAMALLSKPSKKEELNVQNEHPNQVQQSRSQAAGARLNFHSQHCDVTAGGGQCLHCVSFFSQLACCLNSGWKGTGSAKCFEHKCKIRACENFSFIKGIRFSVIHEQDTVLIVEH